MLDILHYHNWPPPRLLTFAFRCTFGALFHEPRRSSAQLAESYRKKAKKLLEIELDCPKVATVQALVALSTFEAASNRDARGWLYCGMSPSAALFVVILMKSISRHGDKACI